MPTALTFRMLFTLAMFRDRPDEMIWQVEGGWLPCFFPLVPFVRVPLGTVKALAARGLIIDKLGQPRIRDSRVMVLSDAGAAVAASLPVAYDHREATIELRTRHIVREALKKATKGTRRKAA